MTLVTLCVLSNFCTHGLGYGCMYLRCAISWTILLFQGYPRVRGDPGSYWIHNCSLEFWVSLTLKGINVRETSKARHWIPEPPQLAFFSKKYGSVLSFFTRSLTSSNFLQGRPQPPCGFISAVVPASLYFGHLQKLMANGKE